MQEEAAALIAGLVFAAEKDRAVADWTMPPDDSAEVLCPKRPQRTATLTTGVNAVKPPFTPR